MAQTNSSTTQDTVIRIVANTLRMKPETISMDSHLEKDLGADSLDAITIAEALEGEYNVEIPNEQLQNFLTIASIVDAIDHLLPHPPPR